MDSGTSAGCRPVLFRLSNDDDRRALHELRTRHRRPWQVHDTLLVQLRDLVKTRHPGQRLSVTELDELVQLRFGDADPDTYGVWVYYPWADRLVHLLDQAEFVELRTNRNRYKITPTEQMTLEAKRIGVVGLSVGHSVALALALERSCGELRLADFDLLDLSNLNRIRTGVHNLGLPKTCITAREIAEIDPYLRVTTFDEGVSIKNVETFLLGGGRLDLVIEECDSLDIKVAVRHHARPHRIPVVMETSDRGMLDIERFDQEPDRPLFHALAGELDPAALVGLTTEEKLPYVLRIVGADTVSTRLRASLIEIDQTISTWPQLGSEVLHGGAAAACCARRILLGHPEPSGRFFLQLDSRDCRHDSGTTCAERPDAESVSPAASGPKPCTDPTIRDLVAQATCAPSGGNKQPWKWKWIADERRLELWLDSERTSGLVDFESLGSIVALGGAAEALVIAAHAAGFDVTMEPFPLPDRSTLAATFDLARRPVGDVADHWRDDLQPLIRLRHTNRKVGIRQPPSPRDLDALTEAVRSIPTADMQWLVDDGPLARVGELLGVADRLRLLHRLMSGEMLSELRWTRKEVETTRDGIDIETLHLSPGDLAGLQMCRDWPSLELVSQWDGGRNLEKGSRRAVAGASAVGLITMPGARPLDYFTGGRAVQRLWLIATERHLAVHPMTILPYLFARVARGHGEGLDERTVANVRRLRLVFDQLFHVDGYMGEVFLFRISSAEATSRRSLRRDLDDVLIQV
jgi:molybdopterin/thiamine biosynthesis adenylyltransferase